MLNPFKRSHSVGSRGHIENLERLAQMHPGDKDISKALNSAKSSSGISLKGAAARIGGFGLGAAFTMAPLFTTPGGLDDKLRAVAGSGASAVGWAAGAKLGAASGAALGSVIPGLGTAVGAVTGTVLGGLAGAIGAEQIVSFGFQQMDRLVEGERAKRHLNWVNESAAFRTRKSATMRQQSLQAMNRGMMASRSVLGREASFMHM
jgi:hypothetical protein